MTEANISNTNHNSSGTPVEYDPNFITEINKEADKMVQSVMPQPQVNAFPVHVFPEPFRKLIAEAHACLNFSNDYMGTAILTAVSLAVGKTAKLKVKSGWYEYAPLYAGLIGNPGAAKTHSLRLVFAPFEGIDSLAIKEFAALQAEFENYQALPKKEKKDALAVVKPILKKNVLQNFTPEILYQRLADNDIGCAVVSDELATWLEGMNNYSKGDQTSVYLSIWSNTPTSIDRVGRPVPLWLPAPYLTLIGTLQPRVLPQLFPAIKTNNGFLQRFLFAFPDDAEKQSISEAEINESVLDDYSQWITNYRKNTTIDFDDDGRPRPRLYHWSDEAKAYFYNWHKGYTDQVNEAGESLKGEILSKYDIHFCRLSLLMQIMQDSTTALIGEEATKAAAALCQYYMATALQVLHRLGHTDPLAGIPQNKQEFYKVLPASFTTAEANGIGAGFSLNSKTVYRFLVGSGLFIHTLHSQWSKK